jgi:hypothetical protein
MVNSFILFTIDYLKKTVEIYKRILRMLIGRFSAPSLERTMVTSLEPFAPITVDVVALHLSPDSNLSNIDWSPSLHFIETPMLEPVPVALPPSPGAFPPSSAAFVLLRSWLCITDRVTFEVVSR